MSAYVSLEEARKHLNIEPDFTDDDDYITDLIESAELVVEKDICTPLSEIEAVEGRIPPPLKRAILLLVGTFYASRETEAYGVLVSKLPAYNHIIGLYRDYSR
jgi:hypothetical protein